MPSSSQVRSGQAGKAHERGPAAAATKGTAPDVVAAADDATDDVVVVVAVAVWKRWRDV
jgi:hypothetical protein